MASFLATRIFRGDVRTWHRYKQLKNAWHFLFLTGDLGGWMMPMVLPCQLPWAEGTDTESRDTDIMSPPGPAAQGGAGAGRGWRLWVWLEWGGKVLHGTYHAFPP